MRNSLSHRYQMQFTLETNNKPFWFFDTKEERDKCYEYLLSTYAKCIDKLI